MVMVLSNSGQLAVHGVALVGFLVEQRHRALKQFSGFLGTIADAGHAQLAELRERADHVKQHPGAAVGLVVDVVADDDVEQVLRNNPR
jgi:hypothetical protein